MDNFLEEVVTSRKTGMQTAMFVIATIMMGVLFILAFFTLQLVLAMINQEGFNTATIINIVSVLITGGGAALLFLRRDRIKTEYEYTFTNGTLDFAQVYNNKKRKPLGTMNVKNVEACGLVASGSFNRYLNMQGVKRINWFLNRDAELFYFYFVKDSVKKMIIIEPSQDMITLIKRYVGQGVFQVN